MSAYDDRTRPGVHLSDAPGLPVKRMVLETELRGLQAYARAWMRLMVEGAHDGYLRDDIKLEDCAAILAEELARPEPGPVPPYSIE